MAHGAVRGAVSAALGLIALQTVATRGSGRVSELFRDVNGIVLRLLDPKVPAIPDLANGETWGGGVKAPAAGTGNTAVGAGAASRWSPVPAPPPGGWPSYNVPVPGRPN